MESSQHHRGVYRQVSPFLSFDRSTNPYGTPFFKPMVEYVQDHFQSTFYGYCNGDLLFHSDLISALHSLASKIETGALKSRVFIVGRRLNYDHQNIVPIPTGIDAQDTFITKYAEQGYLFQTDAEDYFFFTKKRPSMAFYRRCCRGSSRLRQLSGRLRVSSNQRNRSDRHDKRQ